MKKLRSDQKAIYFKYLSQHPLFATVNQQTLQSLVNIHYYSKNSLIYLQFDRVRYLYFLLDGSVTCHRQLPNGQETFMTNFHAHQDCLNSAKLINEIFPSPQDLLQAEISSTPFCQYTLATQNNRHQLTTKAAQNTFLALLPVHDLPSVLGEMGSSPLFSWYHSQLSQQLSNRFVLYDLLNLKTAQAKIAYYLLAHTDNLGLVAPSMNKKNLASILGIRAETLSRTLRALIGEGIVAEHDLGFVIHKPELLFEMVEH